MKKIIIPVVLLIIIVIIAKQAALFTFFFPSMRFGGNSIDGMEVVKSESITTENGEKFVYKIAKADSFVISENPYFFYLYSRQNSKAILAKQEIKGNKIEAGLHFVSSNADKDFYYFNISGDFCYIMVFDKAKETYELLRTQDIKYLDASDNKYQEYISILEKLISTEDWFWILETAEFLLETKSSVAIDILRTFAKSNAEKSEEGVIHYQSLKSYQDIVDYCTELAEKYGFSIYE